MRPTRRERLKGLSFNRMLPNMLTLLALCAGITAIRYSIEGRWEHAVVAVVVAAVLDALDGRLARLMKGGSKFGAELDSLADFASFGVTPGVMLYLWSLKDAGRLGWILALLFSVCCALRLARFNTNLDNPDLPHWAYNFFSGVPAPAAAGLVMLPMYLTFQVGEGIFDRPAVVGTVLVVVAALMVSRVPTFAFKKFKVPHRWVLPTMLFVGLLGASLVSAPWLTLSVIAIIYAGLIPFSVRSYRTLEKKAREIQRRDDKTEDEGNATPEADPPKAT